MERLFFLRSKQQLRHAKTYVFCWL
jgi:hypothetical protein